jgi:hypothetical protein
MMSAKDMDTGRPADPEGCRGRSPTSRTGQLGEQASSIDADPQSQEAARAIHTAGRHTPPQVLESQ